MSILQSLISFFVVPILNLFWFLIIIRVILSWLVSFDVVNMRNAFVAQIYSFLLAITEPVLRPIRRFIPSFQGVDLSPLFLLFFIPWLTWLFQAKIYPLLG